MNEIECETCVKRKTMYCPNHADCYDTINKPYYQNRIMLLEENKQLKEKLQQENDAINKTVNSIKNDSLVVSTKEYGEITVVNSDDLLEILDIDKGEQK